MTKVFVEQPQLHHTVKRYSLIKPKEPVAIVELGVESQPPPKRPFLTAITKINRLTLIKKLGILFSNLLPLFLVLYHGALE